MSTIPSKFELFLSEKSAREYMVKRFSRRNLWIEVSGSPAAFTALIGGDMVHFNQLRAEIRKALAGAEDGSVHKGAVDWIAFLKPRIDILEYQTAIRAAFTAYMAAVVAIFALVSSALQAPAFVVAVVASAAFLSLAWAAWSSLARSMIDRRRAWYKYLTAHLEAIKSQV